MNELNKKLAEWRELKDFKIFADHAGNYYKMQFIDPQHSQVYIVCDAFHLSLDVCFEWLVPELDKKGFEIRMYHSPYTTRTSFVLREPEEPIPGFDWGNEFSALALCLAIEKLIDGGG